MKYIFFILLLTSCDELYPSVTSSNGFSYNIYGNVPCNEAVEKLITYK